MTIREFISTVRNTLNTLTLDTYISGEYIYNVGISIAKLITKRESDSRKIFKNTSQFQTLECIDMEEVSASKCTNISLHKCKSFMRSKKSLPDVFLSSFGSLMFVYNIIRDKEYIETNPSTYKNILNQKFKNKNVGYFWIENKHLIIPDSYIEKVTVVGLFSETVLSEDSCENILDSKFPVLDYLEGTVIQETINEILISKKVIKDEDSNLNQNK